MDLPRGQDGDLLPTTLPRSHQEKQVVFSRDGLRRLKRGLEAAGLDPKLFAWPPEREPYRGLEPLEAADAGIFFGREASIIGATDTLRGLKSAAPPRLLVILGASGAGKSSFLRAGLLPRLACDDRNFLPLPINRPERAALTGENEFLRALETALPEMDRAELRHALAAGALGVRPLLASLAASAAVGEGGAPPAIVIAVDQAEELFRPDGRTESGALLALIRDLAKVDAPLVIAIFAIRSDSYDALQRAEALEDMQQTPAI